MYLWKQGKRSEGGGVYLPYVLVSSMKPTLFPFDSPTTDYSLDFTQHWVLVPIPFHTRQAVSQFPACATVPCNQHRGKPHVGIFPRSEGENALNRRAQYVCTGRGGEYETDSGSGQNPKFRERQVSLSLPTLKLKSQCPPPPPTKARGDGYVGETGYNILI